MLRKRMTLDDLAGRFDEVTVRLDHATGGLSLVTSGLERVTGRVDQLTDRVANSFQSLLDEMREGFRVATGFRLGRLETTEDA